MAVQDIDQYFTYDGRLASFRKTTKKRGSTSSGRGGSKALNWPHKQITPASLAKAGFFFNPSPDSPDNCICFLCQKGLDGWESGDDPLHEHLTHSSECGWAILTAIEQDVQDYALQDPTLPHMVEARKATFAGRWPHDGKKGWQCKTKQLVDAGWMYTPTPESDDMATCTYCQLALDGWEPSDKPYDEHYKRSPNCGFFTIERQPQPAPKKTGRGKGARSSKASRASTQSVQSAAIAASGSSVAGDVTAEPEDSVLTTTSTMAQGKKTKSKKAAATKATKGGRKKAKKEESVAAGDTEDDNASVAETVPAKTTRGRKRGSEAVEDSVVSSTAGPTTKKRATKNTRGSVATESSAMSEDVAVPEANSSAKPKKGRQPKTRKASSASNTSATSIQEEPEHEEFPDDDEIERQLEADLERQFTEDEFAYEYRHKSPPKPSPKTQRTANSHKSATYKMFDPAPSEAGESEIDDELHGLKNEMDVDTVDEIHIPKKGRQAGTRKASKQTTTKTKKQKEPSPSPSPEPVEKESETEDSAPEDNDSVASNDTVIRNEDSAYSSEQEGRTRARKASVGSEDSVNIVTYVEPDDDTPTKRGRQPRKARQSRESTEEPDDQREAESSDDDAVEDDDKLMESDDELHIAEDPVESDAAESSPVRDESHLSVQEPPSTPGHGISPAQSAKQAAVSPSPSPQSSDAENQPPSSKPGATATSKRTALAPLAETPSRTSPSKRNIMAGLQSTTPWTAANLEAIFATPRGKSNKENGVEQFLKQGKDLTSPEKQMTVEEWIYYNAGEAEKQLKYECERMVGAFEGEGTRAMKVLEGLSVE